jgi:restriction system protein
MAIPDFQTVMLPLLKHLADGKEHPNRKVLDALADEFGLTDEERKKLLPSGQDYIFRNRVAWARTHMKAASLINNPTRGIFVITKAGRDLLATKPEKINLKILNTYETYQQFRTKHKSKLKAEEIEIGNEEEIKTPEEQIEEAYEIIRDSLADQILEQLKGASANFFEKVVVEVLVKMGYGGTRKDAGQAIGSSGDEGIDGIIKEDRLGLDIIYIQAKKWENTVSRPEVQKFAGALQGKRARKGIFITTSEFSKGAYEYVAAIDSKIILLDGKRLAQMMMDFNVGVSTEATYELKRIDSDYFA